MAGLPDTDNSSSSSSSSSSSTVLHVVDLSQYPNTQQIQKTLMELTGRRTVPNVFVGGTSIGGGEETRNLQRKGRLVPLLEDAGALTAHNTDNGNNSNNHDTASQQQPQQQPQPIRQGNPVQQQRQEKEQRTDDKTTRIRRLHVL